VSIPVRYWRGVSGAEGIAGAVERAVADHVLGPGARLPTVRALAARLDVSPATVAAAYRRLGDRGIVSGDGRRGTRVTAGPALPARSAPAVPPGALDLARGSPDPRLLPALGPVLRHLDAPAVGYGDTAADVPELVASFTAELAADGVPAHRVVIVSGALDAVERVLQAHLRPGDRVAVEDPGFPRLFDLVAALGLVAVPVALDDRGPRPDALGHALAGGAAAAVVTPRAQNPTGAALDDRRARDLRRVLRDRPEVLVVEDDFAGPVAGTAYRTLATRDRARWAVARSVAKALGPDLRLAALAGDRTTVDRVEGRLRVGPGWVSHTLQRAVLALRTDPRVAERVAQAGAVYARRRVALVDALAGRGIAASGATGLNVWVPVPDEDATIAALAGRGWAVAGGERFRLRSPPAVRITTAALAPAAARRLAADLAAVLGSPGTTTVSA
jgi:DNA-binding transcriptional MocR family regulator